MGLFDIFKKKTDYFNKNITPQCDYCQYGKRTKDGGRILCEKQIGVVNEATASCGKFVYSPLKRIPKKQLANEGALTDEEMYVEVKEDAAKSAPAPKPAPAPIPMPAPAPKPAPAPIPMPAPAPAPAPAPIPMPAPAPAPAPQPEAVVTAQPAAAEPEENFDDLDDFGLADEVTVAPRAAQPSVSDSLTADMSAED